MWSDFWRCNHILINAGWIVKTPGGTPGTPIAFYRYLRYDYRIMSITVYIVFGLAAVWLLMIRPGRGRKERMAAFEKQLIAHRGLYENGGQAPENSMAAFRAAAERGFGIELDVRLTADERLVIMHDETLKRAAGIDRPVISMTWRELKEVRLFDSEECVPLFSDMLKMVGGRVPLIIELKCERNGDVTKLCEEAACLLDAYEGETCIESFHPLVVRWFKKNRPQTIRGQLSERFSGIKYPGRIGGFLLSCCAMNFLTKPDFIAYNVKQAGLLRFRIMRDLFHTEMAGWTVTSEEQAQSISRDFDVLICEKFIREEGNAERAAQRKTPGTMKNHTVRKHMLISGRVTAVGFRYRAVRIAQQLGVTGWVRNTDDDRVEMELQGTPQMLSEMMRRLRGEKYIEIEGVEETDLTPHDSEYEFKVRY